MTDRISLEQAEGIAVEFGMYENDSLTLSPNDVHYWNHDGVRFTEINLTDYIKYISPRYYTIYQLLQCKINNPMTIQSLIEECHSQNSWRAKNSALIDHNCQDFMICVMGTFGALLWDPIQYSFGIPDFMGKALECNEKN